MTTYREAIYMCLDLLKGTSDDFSYTEDHIAYLLDKFRALLLKQRYGADPKKHIPYGNYQTLKIEKKNHTNDEQFYPFVTFDTKVPFMLQLGIPRLYYENDVNRYYETKWEYVSRERFPFVGNNKFLKNITYFTIDDFNNVLIHNDKEKYWLIFGGSNVVYKGPNKFNLVGVFENPRDIIGEDYLDANIPIEETLVTTLIGMVVESLAKVITAPSDTINNGTDENASMPTTMQKGKNS